MIAASRERAPSDARGTHAIIELKGEIIRADRAPEFPLLPPERAQAAGIKASFSLH
jgi:hypothetical protein